MTMIDSTDWVPDACTLPTAERPLRVAEFDRFFAESVRSWVRPHAMQLDLLVEPDAELVGRDLAKRESGCCSFFGFDFDTVDREVVMSISVPAAHVDVLDALQVRVAAAHSGTDGSETP